MHLDVTPEMLLTEIGYTKTDTNISQVEGIIKNTNGFNKFAKHIISLNQNLKHMKAYVGISNSVDHLKIKCDVSDAPEILQEFHDTIKHWSDKYDVEIEKVNDKEVYYIKGSN